MGTWRGAVAALAALVFTGLGHVSTVSAEVFTGGPGDDIEAMISTLQPGDELVLSGGMYTLTERFSLAIAGTENAPIIIRAQDGETPHLHRPNANQNIIDIDNAEHVTIRSIEFSGGSAGIRISSARHLTIEECEVHDTGDVAVRANDTGVTYESLRILRNHIHHTNNTGEGMYLGCNNAGCEVVSSLIEGNYVHHTNQPSVSQGDGIELKEGSFGNVIRDNVIHDTNYPCILTYASNGAPNIIERNVMWNCGDHGIQSAADAVIRNNIILSANADGIAMQPHQSGSPSSLEVVHNTVLEASGDAISLRGISGPVVIANNALYAQTGRAFFVNGGTSGLVFEGNSGVGGASDPLVMLSGSLASDFVDASFDGAPPMDLFPALGSTLEAAGSAAHVTIDDFNGTSRDGVADVGAYAFSAEGNPGWALNAAFKTSTPSNTPGAGGSSGNSGGSGGGSNVSNGGASSGCSIRPASDGSADLLAMIWLLGMLVRRRSRA
ncbi:MAG: right-handed parallel beta-helix repeat-containing protein [Myxococcales bacterium]|nr:right-handed parallel beta-helix repeat-containing protein [Myxococcales bacterium]